MQKYIAVVNPKMNDDQISKLMAQDIAGAIFSISHQNYPLAAKLIQQVKRLSRKHNRPVSLIQDATDMIDPLDLEFGMRNGIDWVVVADANHVRLARKFNQTLPVIWKGQSLPKKLPVDSIMSISMPSPDASVQDQPWLIRHQPSPHVKQRVLESIQHIAKQAGASAIATSDLEEAKAWSQMRPQMKIIFAPKDPSLAARGAILWGVHPIFGADKLHATLRNQQLVRKGERFVDATNAKHVTINSV